MVSDSVPLADQSTLQTPRHRGSRRVATLWLLAIGAVLVVLAPWLLVEAVWDGYFPLTLDVRSESGKAVKVLSYATFFEEEQAQWVTTHINRADDSCFRPADQDNGRFVANIGCSGRTWIFNIERKYTEPRHIVLQATYEDGKEIRRFAEIPAGRGPRSLVVTVP